MKVETTDTWYKFSTEKVKERFSGELSYVNTFCLNGEDEPVAVYLAANPDRSKGHKDYVLLQISINPTSKKTEALVRGLDFQDMDKHKIQTGIECKHCGDVIFSRARHDFCYCECNKVAIDGGKLYTRVIGDNKDYSYVNIDLLSQKVIR